MELCHLFFSQCSLGSVIHSSTFSLFSLFSYSWFIRSLPLHTTPSTPLHSPSRFPPSFAGEAAVVGRRCPCVSQGSGVAVGGIWASLTGDGAWLPMSRLTPAAAAIFFRAALYPRPPPPRAAGPAAAPSSLIPLHLAPPLPPRGKTSRMGTGPRAPSSPSPTTNHPRVGTGPAATILPVCTTSKR